MEDARLILPSSPHMTASLWQKRPFVGPADTAPATLAASMRWRTECPQLPLSRGVRHFSACSGSKGHSGVQKTRTPLPPFWYATQQKKPNNFSDFMDIRGKVAERCPPLNLKEPHSYCLLSRTTNLLYKLIYILFNHVLGHLGWEF